MDSTGVKYRYFVILLSIVCQSINGEGPCVSKSSPSAFKLSCPQVGGQIVSVDIESGIGDCQNNQVGCYGEPASLLVSTHNCYWHQNCTVDFPQDIIIRSQEDPGSANCFGLSPQFMKLNKYLCFTPLQGKGSDNLLDICSSRNSSYDYGLIRSHWDFPWLYDPRAFENKECYVAIYGRPGYQLLVTVLDMEVGEDDKLSMTVINSGVSTERVLKPDMTEGITADIVKFTFKVGDHSNGGRGFVICFTFIGENDRIKNACDDVTEKGDILYQNMVSDESTTQTPMTTAKVCRNKKGKVKKCRKKNNKKQRKKTKKPKKDRKKKDKKKKDKKNKKDKKGKKKRHIES